MSLRATNIPGFHTQLGAMNYFAWTCSQPQLNLFEVRDAFEVVQTEVLEPNGVSEQFILPSKPQQLPGFLQEMKIYARREFDAQAHAKLAQCLRSNAPNASLPIEGDLIMAALSHELISPEIAQALIESGQVSKSLFKKKVIATLGIVVGALAVVGGALWLGGPLEAIFGGIAYDVAAVKGLLHFGKKWDASTVTELRNLVPSLQQTQTV